MHRFLLILSVFLAFFLGGQYTAAQGPSNVLVAQDRTEPIVAVDPRAPSTIIVGTNTNYDAPVGGTYPDGFFTSHDGGKSFRAGSAPVLSPWTTEADPSMVIAGSGTAFFTYLAESPSYCSQAGGSAIIVSRSYDGGRTFGRPTIVDRNPADDKPFSAVESFPGQRAHTFVSWTRQIGKTDAIWFARSANGGDSFSPPVQLYRSSNNNFGSIPVVGPHGHISVIWSSYPDRAYTQFGTTALLLRTSSDDGRHFGPVHAVKRRIPTLALTALPGQLRNQTTPSVVAASDGSLYVAWSQRTRIRASGAADADIMVSRSTTNGRSWSTPHSVNDVHANDRFMPALAPLPDGSVGAVFYDRRRSSGLLDVYAARFSFSGGFHASTNVRLTQGTAPVSDILLLVPGHSSCFYPGRFFGDYIGAAAGQNGELDAVWADTQAHVPNRTDIWFARTRLPAIR